MTNADKYKLDAYAIEGLTKDFDDWYYRYERNIINTEPSSLLNEFLNANTNPTLTEEERVILRNVKWKGYSATHIGRARENKGSFIYLRFENDIEMTYFFDNFFGHLFQFIKVRRRIRDKRIIRRRINENRI